MEVEDVVYELLLVAVVAAASTAVLRQSAGNKVAAGEVKKRLEVLTPSAQKY